MKHFYNWHLPSLQPGTRTRLSLPSSSTPQAQGPNNNSSGSPAVGGATTNHVQLRHPGNKFLFFKCEDSGRQCLVEGGSAGHPLAAGLSLTKLHACRNQTHEHQWEQDLPLGLDHEKDELGWTALFVQKSNIPFWAEIFWQVTTLLKIIVGIPNGLLYSSLLLTLGDSSLTSTLSLPTNAVSKLSCGISPMSPKSVLSDTANPNMGSSEHVICTEDGCPVRQHACPLFWKKRAAAKKEFKAIKWRSQELSTATSAAVHGLRCCIWSRRAAVASGAHAFALENFGHSILQQSLILMLYLTFIHWAFS